ncbi:MAG: hypothetical protein ACTSR8_00565 [Promethearchaeota archaeon]
MVAAGLVASLIGTIVFVSMYNSTGPTDETTEDNNDKTTDDENSDGGG